MFNTRLDFTSMGRRSDHSREEIREMALAIAERIVRREGYAGLSARKVAKPMGYTVGTLYLVFKNLDELILHVNARTLDSLYATTTQAFEKAQDPHERVIAIASAYIDFATKNTRRWSMLFEHRHSQGEQRPPWYDQKVARSLALVERALMPLAQHRSANEIKQAAHTLWGGVHGICILALSQNLDTADLNSARVLVESLVDNYLRGFTAGSIHMATPANT